MHTFDQRITEHIWLNKYRHGDEAGPLDTHRRVISGVYANDAKYDTSRMMSLMDDFIWVPGGRIYAGAGTSKRVTLINCFVNERVPDSMEGIMNALSVAAYTQQQGGGIGTGFSSLRPAGAVVRRTGSVSSGVLPFMDMWNSMCATVKSSGSRRGAMMATLACWHPDLPAFISAKCQPGRLTNFNVSVLVTDEFMRAVEADGDWDLGFHEPPADGSAVIDAYPPGDHRNFTSTRWWRAMFPDRAAATWYVYRRVKEAALWNDIIRNTYEWAEPGVIFIDRVNDFNNLGYCEFIDCTNPCGEQPLPPHGDCDLGHVNLAACVRRPFTLSAAIDWLLIETAVCEGVRFLDNVMDVTHFPVPEQEAEAKAKRRIGLGFLGLGNMLQMMRVRYGSPESVAMAGSVMRFMRDAAYTASINLAKERGAFPAFDRDKYCAGLFMQSMPPDIVNEVRMHGIRNGVLLTLAPTGTTSMYVGNVSSGCEPTFGWMHWRKMLKDGRDDQARDRYDEFLVEDYGFRAFLKATVPERDWKAMRDKVKAGDAVLPNYMVTAQELSVDDHLSIQCALQRYVDASISKTINCPEDMPYADFRDVYTKAYALGLKGVTTYRPSGVRGAVLSVTPQLTGPVDGQAGPVGPQCNVGPAGPTDILTPRPDQLTSITYKRKWQFPGGMPVAYYITISDIEEDGVKRPFEMFIMSMAVDHFEWITALTRTISSIFRRNKNVDFLIEELKHVHSPMGGMFIDNQYVPSLVAMLAGVIENHIACYSNHVSKVAVEEPRETISVGRLQHVGELCPSCSAPSLIRSEGCKKCITCGYSSCG